MRWARLTALGTVAVALLGCTEQPKAVSRLPAPPPGVSVFFITQTEAMTRNGPGHPLVAVTWDGKVAGEGFTVGPCHEICAPLAQSPDGSRILQGQSILTPTGHVLTDSLGGVWADDSRHLCLLSGEQVLNPSVVEYLPGRSGSELRAVVGPTNYMPRITTCSAAGHKAALVDAKGGGDANLFVVDMASGQFYRHAYHPAVHTGSPPSEPWIQLAVSHDISYAAESYLQAAARPPVPPQLTQTPRADQGIGTDIRDLRTGEVVGHVAQDAVKAFSWDDSWVVAINRMPNPNFFQTFVVNWHTGEVIWSQQGLASQVVSQPDGNGLAITIQGFGSRASTDVWLVHTDGRGAKLIGRQVSLLGRFP